jgi:purine nucleoside phosphorylase
MGAIAVVSNLGAGLSEQALLHSDVTEVVAAAAQRLGDAMEWAIAERAARRQT